MNGHVATMNFIDSFVVAHDFAYAFVPLCRPLPLRSYLMSLTGSTKLLGLKASNAFWNPRYYDPRRRTLTKPLMVLSRRQLLHELQTLAFLAVRSNRTLIVPNVLIGRLASLRKTTVH